VSTPAVQRWFAYLLCAAATGASCASPPPAAPSPGQIAGAWLADSTLVAASGGECVGAGLQSDIGRRDVLLAALDGQSAMNATITSTGNGTRCAYAGTNAAGTVGLTMTSCQQSRVLNVACANGGLRDLQLVSATLNAKANSQLGTGSGADMTNWTVFLTGTNQPVGTLSITASFTWVFLGLPASNYHVFTGTIFPGYADGTISIPADPNPWCLPCGWFW
jgi:hypothetical protein